MLDRGGRHAKKHGFRASGMDALAAAAGVTTGALYKQFAGKSDFFVALLEAELRRTEERFASVPSESSQAIGQVQADYLSLQHVRAPERGCLLPSLTAEVARAEPAARAAYQSSLRRIHAIVEGWTGSSDKAWTLIAQNVGAVMLARAMCDEGDQRDLLESVRREGQTLLEGNR
jgi:TetR/AcrR family transcriptional repressor of nem operon